ncbi:unnamed protein product [Rangifer tarandus platyrhynchus]|uniref:Uncharacterized protein n=1 Tax=Rangifer tarandus platyrhynchus TaxID=3082113 RepID=A0ABN9AAJ9_RANTA|nr:unnamed protein product [Rangifer tarandus platyrhynchus]
MPSSDASSPGGTALECWEGRGGGGGWKWGAQMGEKQVGQEEKEQEISLWQFPSHTPLSPSSCPGGGAGPRESGAAPAPAVCQPAPSRTWSLCAKTCPAAPLRALLDPVGSLLFGVITEIAYLLDLPGGTMDKNPPANAGDMGLIPGPGRFHRLRSN